MFLTPIPSGLLRDFSGPAFTVSEQNTKKARSSTETSTAPAWLCRFLLPG